MMSQTKKKISIHVMTKVAILAVLAFILQQFSFPVPMLPVFLKLDASDLPAVIGGFALGPAAGVAIVALKNMLHLFQTSTAGIGELSNFLVGAAFVLPASFIYQYTKTKKGAFLGLALGCIMMPLVGLLTNYFIILPFYAKTVMPMENIIRLGTIVNPNIDSLRTLLLYGILPFNLLKAIVLSALTLLIYKRVSPLLSKK